MTKPTHETESVNFCVKENEHDFVSFYRTCISCGGRTNIRVDSSLAKRWNSGEHIQNVFTHLNSDQRELMINGSHADCWNYFMGAEDE